jgi:hypothetical protein
MRNDVIAAAALAPKGSAPPLRAWRGKADLPELVVAAQAANAEVYPTRLGL